MSLGAAAIKIRVPLSVGECARSHALHSQNHTCHTRSARSFDPNVSRRDKPAVSAGRSGRMTAAAVGLVGGGGRRFKRRLRVSGFTSVPTCGGLAVGFQTCTARWTSHLQQHLFPTKSPTFVSNLSGCRFFLFFHVSQISNTTAPPILPGGTKPGLLFGRYPLLLHRPDTIKSHRFALPPVGNPRCLLHTY